MHSSIKHRQAWAAERIAPMSFSQQRLFFLQQFAPESWHYNIPIELRLTGRLDLTALEWAINEIIRRHESLRTTFTFVEGAPSQLISPQTELKLSVFDLKDIPDGERELEAQRIISEQTRRPFDLLRGPLMRVDLLRLSEEENIFLLTMHHVVTDAWSISVFARELASLYEAFSAGRESPLTELPVQYADYAAWQRDWAQGEVLDRQMAYWKAWLADAPALELPTVRPRAAAQTHAGARYPFEISKDLTGALRALSRRERVTQFMTLLALFDVLLYRYTGQVDVSVGTPTHGRNRSEFAGLIGFFVNTLVLRTDLSGCPSFRELLSRVRNTALGAYAHQDLPFEKLVEGLRPKRNLNSSPLFRALLALENMTQQEFRFEGLSLTGTEVDTGSTEFDLCLFLRESEERLQGAFRYSSDIFDEAMIGRMVGHFQKLLEEVVAKPDVRINELSMLPDPERRQILVEWNNTRREYPREKRAHEMFEEQAERTPKNVALIYESRQVTYEELDYRANHLARRLRELGVTIETLVGICMERSPEMVVAVLGVLKAGGAYAPLDPNYPQERLRYILEDSQISLILTDAREDRIPKDGVRSIRLDSSFPENGENPVPTGVWAKLFERKSVEEGLKKAWSTALGRALYYRLKPGAKPLSTGHPHAETILPELPESGVSPLNPAYVIYTSGSTGTPKGVINHHRGVINRLAWMWETYPYRANDVCCLKTSFNFADSVSELFGPLLGGVPIVIIADDDVKDISRFARILKSHRVTRLVLVPSLLRELLKLMSHPETRLDALSVVISSGEALTADLAESFAKELPHARLLNLYGSSEVAADVTWSDLSERETTDRVTIGRPIWNTEAYIVDGRMEITPIGVAGELYIGGAGLAHGYLNKPELTAERFVPNPFSESPGARLYRTGDLARWLPDGNIEFLGRTDHQVKIRGCRIEPGEIEAALMRNAGVAQAVVIAREDIPGDLRLVAYVVSKGDCKPQVSELRNFLKEILPEYMSPSFIVILEEFPLSPNGKVDRRALPIPGKVTEEMAGKRVTPRTQTEELLAGIWAEALRVQRVGRDDNFFELGGHSLLAMRIVARVRDTLQVELPVRTIFTRPTLKGLAESLDRLMAEQSGPVERIERVARDHYLPLSYNQEVYLFLDWRMKTRSRRPFVFNTAIGIQFEGELKIDLLQQALNLIIQRHEILRTAFYPARRAATSGTMSPAGVQAFWQRNNFNHADPGFIAPPPFRQSIRSNIVLKIAVRSLQEFPEAIRHDEALRIADEDIKRPFDYESPPLMRATLLKMDDRTHLLMIIVHHLIFDRWSLRILKQELEAIYASLSDGAPRSLPELPIQYADFAAWQRNWLNDGRLEERVSYWVPIWSQFAESDRMDIRDLPFALPKAMLPTFKVGREILTLEHDFCERLRAFAHRRDITLYILFLAALSIQFHLYTGKRRIVIRTPFTHRTRSEIENLIGWFSNAHMLFVTVSPDIGLQDFLEHVRDVVLGASANSDLHAMVLRHSIPQDQGQFRSLFNTPTVWFDLFTEAEPTSVHRLTIKNVYLPHGMDGPLSMFVLDNKETMKVVVRYALESFLSDSMQKMVKDHQAILDLMLTSPDAPISYFSLHNSRLHHSTQTSAPSGKADAKS